MNKKYLFRVWDKKTKQMFYPDKYFNFIVEENGEPVVWSVSEAIYLFNSRFTIMRYIGRDKNDNDIWEKDIVRKDTFFDDESKDEYLDATYIGVAYLSNCVGAVIRQLKVWQTDNPYESKLLQDIGNTPALTKLVFARTTVIGNIYENEDILEYTTKNYDDYDIKTLDKK